MTAPLIAGVDAGGTRLRAGVGTSPDDVRARIDVAALRLRVAGPRALAIAIAAAVRRALAAARLAQRVEALVVGAAGAGTSDAALGLKRALLKTGIAREVTVVTDAELMLADAFGDGPGIVLIAGTGSIAMARLAEGRLVRAGGLGVESGDPGSAYAVGRAAIDAVASGAHVERVATEAAESRGEGEPAVPLAAALRAAAGLGPGASLTEWAARAGPTRLAALAPVVLAAAREGDERAERVVDEATGRLAGLVAELGTGPTGATEVALAGGMFSDAAFRERTVAALGRAAPDIVARSGTPDGMRGALRLAAALLAR